VANGIVIRPSADQANVSALQDAFEKMQALSESDNRSWVYWAEFHGFNRYECWHGARTGPAGTSFPYDLFLPWHRAYLTFFDNVARDQNPGAVLPWWDWTTDESHANGVPAAYRAQPALASGPMPSIQGAPARRTRRGNNDPNRLPTPAQVDHLVNDLTDFRDFSNQLQGVHDRVHGWVSGDMGVIATSAFDPVFWAHHAMIDRIWYLWQLKNGVNNIPPDYLDKALFPGLTVAQVLDVHALGYEYATGAAAVPVGSDVPDGAAVPPDAIDPGAPAGGGDAGGGGDADAGGEPAAGDDAEPQAPITPPPVELDPVPVGGLDPDPTRVDIEFHDLDHAGASYEGRVYVNNPDANADTGYDEEARYAGSYYIFGHGGCLGDAGHCEVKPRRRYDPRPAHPLTKAKKVVIGNDVVKKAIADGGDVRLTVVPIVEPIPYEDVDPKHTEDPVDIGYVRIVTYR
jgi:tyrosinase